LIRDKADKSARASPVAPDLESALASASAEERWAAVRAAESRPDAVDLLRRVLASETDPRVREVIFTALVRIGTRDSAEVVVPHLRSDDASLRTAAMDALRAMPEVAGAHLAELLADPDPDVRILACDVARTATGVDSVQLLIDLLEIESVANVCGAAVDVLADIGDSRALAPLDRCKHRFATDPFLAFGIAAALDSLSGPRRRG